MLLLYRYIILVSLVTTLIYLMYYVINVYYLVRHRSDSSNNMSSASTDVTILVPVFNERLDVFKRVIERISAQGSRFVVVGDSSNEPYRSIVEERGGVFVYLKVRRGKRTAISEGIKYVNTKYVLFVDSDTVIPVDAVQKMLKQFRGNIGGVGANISVRKSENGASYSSEFLERTREVILKAMSARGGSVMVIDGKCAMYKCSIIKPLLLSDEFRKYKVLGKPTMIGDDQQMTAYLIKNGYRAAKSFDVTVETEPPEDFKQFTKQSIRWARSSYYYFMKNLTDGTAIKGGPFYTFEAISTFFLPILTLILGLSRIYLDIHLIGTVAVNSFQTLVDFVISNLVFSGTRKFIQALTLIGLPGPMIFASAVTMSVKRERLRTLAYGGIALAIMFFTSLYGFLTCWKQSKWLTR